MKSDKNYQPLEDRVLIEEIKNSESERTESGLIKVGEKPEKIGVVKRIGGGRYAFDTGEYVETTLKEGDTVIFVPNSAMPLDLDLDGDGKMEYWLMREGDVLIRI